MVFFDLFPESKGIKKLNKIRHRKVWEGYWPDLNFKKTYRDRKVKNAPSYIESTLAIRLPASSLYSIVSL